MMEYKGGVVFRLFLFVEGLTHLSKKNSSRVYGHWNIFEMIALNGVYCFNHIHRGILMSKAVSNNFRSFKTLACTLVNNHSDMISTRLHNTLCLFLGCT